MLRAGAEKTANPGVCFFLPQITLPKRIEFTPALIILDVRYGYWTRRIHDLARWAGSIDQRAGVVALYTIGDPETHAALIETRYVDLPVDHAAIATCANRVVRVAPLRISRSMEWTLSEAPTYLNRKHRIVAITGSAEVERLLTDLTELLDQHQNADNFDLQRANWILAILRQMPVPMIWYEEAARSLGRAPLSRLIERIGSFSRDEGRIGPVLQTVRMGLLRLYDLLKQENPRAETVRRQLVELVNTTTASDILVLVRDRTVERALRSWVVVEAFADADWLSRLTVLACPSFVRSATHRFAAALINGAFPRRYRWIAGASLAVDVQFVAYEQERRFIESQLREIYGASLICQRATRRAQTLTGAGPASSSAEAGGKADVMLPELQLVNPPRRRAVDDTDKDKQDKPRKLHAVAREDLAREWAQLQQAKGAETARAEAKRLIGFEDSGEDDTPGILDSADVGTVNDGELTECLRFDVISRTHGIGVMSLPPEHFVEFMRPGEGDDIQRDVSRSLRPGDVLLRVDEEGRASVFDHVVELAEGQPQMHFLSRWRQVWRGAVERMAAKYRTWHHRIDYKRLLGDLQHAGAPIESELAVRLWVEEIVIGPLSQASIVAVGRISGTEVLVSQSRQFDYAFRHIRAIRRGIGRRLSGVIRKSFRQVASAAPDLTSDNLDDRLTVPLEELLETIDLAEVQSVSRDVTNVPASWIGRFRQVG
jgi:hypothetical protein